MTKQIHHQTQQNKTTPKKGRNKRMAVNYIFQVLKSSESQDAKTDP